MAQRVSGYDRKAGDAYWTPQWVFDALYSVEDFREPFDCAPRNSTFDFLREGCSFNKERHIVTNPPFSLATQFCYRAISTAKKVAMLLPFTFDAAKTRLELFNRRPFKAKYTLVDRIRWENLDQKKNGPSSNHAWYVWDWNYIGVPFMGWLKRE